MQAGFALMDHQAFDMRGVLDLGTAVVAPGMAGDDRHAIEHPHPVGIGDNRQQTPSGGVGDGVIP